MAGKTMEMADPSDWVLIDAGPIAGEPAWD